MDESTDKTSAHLHSALTGLVLGCAFEVINELGAGFLESVYERALLLAVREKGLKASTQQESRVMFRGQCVGIFYADMIVEETLLVELKAVRALAAEHHAQVINYLKATDIEVGLLINFGNTKLEYRRFTRAPPKQQA